MKKKVIFITQGIYPLNGGKHLASYGYCDQLSKYCHLKVFSLLQRDITVKEAIDNSNKELDIEYYHSQGYGSFLLEKKFRLIDRLISKFSFVTPIYREFIRGIENYIENNRVEVVIIDHIGMVLYFKFLKKKFPNIEYIYNSHNVEYLNTFEEHYGKVVFSKSIFGYIKYSIAQKRCLYRKKLEEKLLVETDYTFCISKGDIEKLKESFNLSTKKLIFAKPLIKFERIKYQQDVKTLNYKLMIVGSMNWYPNVKGIMWFIDNVYNKLIEVFPQSKLYLVGKNPDNSLLELAKKYGDSIIVTGEVKSTTPYFYDCDISIVPVFEGTGAKIKVLESISKGIPTICSSFAAKDYDIVDEICVANNKYEFLSAIISLYEDQKLREKYNQNSEKYIKSYYKLNEEIIELFKS